MDSSSSFNSTSPTTHSPLSFPDPTPEYVAEDISAKLLVVAISVMVLSVIFATLRCTVRIVHHSPWGLGDYLLAPALVTLLATCSICIVQVTAAGVGRHLLYLVQHHPEKLLIFAQTGYATEILYAVTVAFSKLSILAFYLRIFTPGSTANIAGRNFRVTVYITGFILTATALACAVTSLVSCRPLAARWNPMMPKSSCINLGVYWFSTGIPNVITDVVMLVLPLPGFWRLKLSRGKRLGLMGVFMLGSLGLIASIARLSVIFSSVISAKRSAAAFDGSWVAVDIAAWSMIEAGSYIIAACLPTLRPLFMDGVQLAKRVTNVFSRTPRRTSCHRNDIESAKVQLTRHVSVCYTDGLANVNGSQTAILGGYNTASSTAGSIAATITSLADTTSTDKVYQTRVQVEEDVESCLPRVVPFLPPLQLFVDFSLDFEGGSVTREDLNPRSAMANSAGLSWETQPPGGDLGDRESTVNETVVDLESNANTTQYGLGTEPLRTEFGVSNASTSSAL